MPVLTSRLTGGIPTSIYLHSQADLEKEMKVFDQSLLLMHSFGRQVCPKKVEAAQAQVVLVEPGWPAALEALVGCAAVVGAGAAQSRVFGVRVAAGSGLSD